MSLLRLSARLLAPAAALSLAAPAVLAQPANPLRQVEQSLAGTRSMTAQFT